MSNSAWSNMKGTGNVQYTSLDSQSSFAPLQNPTRDQYGHESIPLQQDFSYKPHKSPYGDPRIIGSAWQPGFWNQFPWTGIGALIIAILATLACVVVLTVSHNVPIDSWKGTFQPTVYVSICTAIANITLTYALYEGVVISFWRRAGGGATLKELHLYWHAGTSFKGAFESLIAFRGKAVAMACIFTILSILRGPIMQRAALVDNTTIFRSGTMTIHSAPELPMNYAGRTTGRTSSPSFMNPNFTNIVQAYTAGDPINAVYDGCEGTCLTKVKGFGFGVACNISYIPYSLAPEEKNGSVRLIDPVEVYSVTANSLQIYGHGGTKELYDSSYSSKINTAVLLNATFMANSTQNMTGNLFENTCALRAGIVEYAVRISNHTLTLQSNDWTNDTFLEDRGFAYLPSNSYSNVAGFILAARGIYAGSAQMQFGGGVGWILNLEGASANRYFERANPADNFFDIGSNMTWRNPMNDMINSMREIAFRTALQLAADNRTYVDAVQNVPFEEQLPKTIYTTNFDYMIAAVIVSLVGVISVIPTYWKFWELGRPMTLSPVEIAKAFSAPMLAGVQVNRHASEMLDEVGNTKVRYGDAGPVSGVASGNDGSLRRLEIGPANMVVRPERGVRYV